jgi:hypothetical protein
MPPPAPKVSSDIVYEFLCNLRPGLYTIKVDPDFEPYLAREGSSYFAVGDLVLTIWKNKSD